MNKSSCLLSLSQELLDEDDVKVKGEDQKVADDMLGELEALMSQPK